MVLEQKLRVLATCVLRPRINPLFLCLLILVWTATPASANATNGPIFHLTIEDAIGPATEDYFLRAMQRANDNNASLIISRMDTPGGLDSAMRSIIKAITNSRIPVVTYVGPTGARAASAGTYILYASHVAAMAPGTNLGAATPVQIGGVSPAKQDDDKQKGNSAMEHKVINDAVAYIRGLASLHGRNQDWAEKAVRQAASLPAEEAVKMNVIDLMATGINDLIRKLDGRTVKILGATRTLQTTGVPIQEVAPDWRSQLLSVLTNPNVAYILMLIGIYGLIFEFSNPGAIVPGTVGAICLILALYSFQMLPINYAGVALIILGVGLMVGEAFEPSFGILGIGGVIAFVFGSIILMDTDVPGFGINLSVIITFTLTSILMFVFVISMAIKANRRAVVSGLEEMLHSEGIVFESFEHQGKVKVHSELWNAISEKPVKKGQTVRITGVKGLTLKVEPLET